MFSLAVLWRTKCEFDTAETTNTENVLMRHEHVDHSSETYWLFLDSLLRSGATNLNFTISIRDGVIGIFN